MPLERIHLSWINISKYNRLTLGALLLAMLLATKVLILVVISSIVTLNVCNSPICVQEAAKLKQYIDTNVHPCDNFYYFACGNFLKNAQGDEKLGYLKKFKEEWKRELLKIYREPLHDNDHTMVKTAKKLFNACMNVTEIEKDNLQTIKEALGVVGGWPVVEGLSWNETEFNWVDASYKLRELGYHFSTFLELQLQLDPVDKGEYILSVRLPNVWNYKTQFFNNLDLMSNVAVMFGAKDTVRIRKELIKVQDFLLEMQIYAHSPFYNSNAKFTVQRYQEEHTTFNWLEYINNMARPSVHISQHDFVVFPIINVTTEWFRILSKTPKRTRANYMMWKVIQEAFPYLTAQLQKRANIRSEHIRREEFCLRETEDRFVPSPAGVIYNRRHLSQDTMYEVEEQIMQIKSKLVDILNQTEWLEEDERIEIMEKANAVSLVFGTPGNWSSDQILDDLDVDMMGIENGTFLSLIAQANRNHITGFYNNIKKSVPETLTERLYIRKDVGLPLYSAEDNIIYIPSVALRGSLFHQHTPRYLNYGALGYQLGGLITGHMKTTEIHGYQVEGWSNHTKEAFSKKIACVAKELEDSQESKGLLEIITQTVGQQIAYAAYEDWVEDNGEELKLHGVEYTPKQLFWISAATTFCQPISSHNSTLPDLFRDSTFIAHIVSVSIRNIPEFAKDFDCPLGSKMNPSNRCNFLDYRKHNRTIVL